MKTEFKKGDRVIAVEDGLFVKKGATGIVTGDHVIRGTQTVQWDSLMMIKNPDSDGAWQPISDKRINLIEETDIERAMREVQDAVKRLEKLLKK
jgi:hypothetical protein